ncbi:6-pyruvoyl trahydropterin synthase family protein [Humisphaera borealis]|uniref:6-carboxy-5,6,7,8-tetrahydropterin synthase n=1 Tax=Humisphaera borealis TaxID=2807512 RepID=A0A7M2WPV4_9BACT|nr:6-carboxytetrahydropterin synthase [Humisphaera borealis]QOV87496.1 6-carboxytetrahydropterin synthase [Humisphaera borealis]
MFRLSREVRFAINAQPDAQLSGRPSNAYGGFPSLTGLGHYFTLEVTLSGALDAASQYVRNIKDIDDAVRRLAIGRIERHIRERTFGGGAQVVVELFGILRDAWPGATLEQLKWGLSPFLHYAVRAEDFQPDRPEHSMVRLSQKFEFSASHRLHNPSLSDQANRDTFGKCNNPHGHGHNYEVQVTLAGEPDAGGVLVDVPVFERIVAEAAIDRFDHKNLNVELPEFEDVIPSVENIARAIYRLLKPRFSDSRGKLASVTVWETPKTSCEYSE